MIADGAGVGVWTAGVYENAQLAVKSMPVIGLVDTRSGRHKVTDSAAGASAFATGERVTNRTISVGPAAACPLLTSRDTAAAWPNGCEPLESWFDIARTKDKATGLVTTAAVVMPRPPRSSRTRPAATGSKRSRSSSPISGPMSCWEAAGATGERIRVRHSLVATRRHNAPSCHGPRVPGYDSG
ncbi:MAG: alkaline phosphatase [Longimicrobiales bacterium]